MAFQNCPHEGDDHRTFGTIVCWLQRKLSWYSAKPPRWLWVRFQLFPFGKGLHTFVSWGVAWPPYVVKQWLRNGNKVGLFRLGWRYDVNAQAYIFPAAALKFNNTEPMERGY